MKEKLNKIREALFRMGYQNPGTPTQWFNNYAKDTLEIVDSILTELESPELVEKVAKSIVSFRVCGPQDHRRHQVESFWNAWTGEALAAINTIKRE